jgi:hypothetical protein
MPAMDTITAFATAAAAGGSAMAAAAGDTLQVRATPPGKMIKLLQLWCDVQTSGFLQITSPKFHDNTRGLRFRNLAAEVKPKLPFPSMQRLYEQDLLAATVSGAAVAGDIESLSMLVYYEQLEGVNARFIDVATMKTRAVEMVTVEDTITSGAGGGYTGGEAINAESDLLKANTDYALVGYKVQTQCATVCWRGADTGNLRVSGPGDALGEDYTKSWFILLSNAFGLPLIPVFNSANRAGITIDVVQDENAAAVQVDSMFVELA